MSKATRKGLRITKDKKSEFLLRMLDGQIETTYSIKYALDISDWSLEKFQYLVSNLAKLGYRVEVVDLK